MTECSVEDCGQPHLAKGLCRNHYYRQRRNGHTGLQDRSPKQCTIEGCETVAKTRGMCGKHYQRWKAHGSVSPDPQPVEFDEWFWSRVDVGDPDTCWPWRLGLFTAGYGSLRREGKPVSAHRVAYELARGSIPEGLEIDHVCHDPAECRGGNDCPHRRCCNPAHLVPKTHADNCAADRTILATLNKARGRQKAA